MIWWWNPSLPDWWNGRHVVLRTPWEHPCRFDSCIRHHDWNTRSVYFTGGVFIYPDKRLTMNLNFKPYRTRMIIAEEKEDIPKGEALSITNTDAAVGENSYYPVLNFPRILFARIHNKTTNRREKKRPGINKDNHFIKHRTKPTRHVCPSSKSSISWVHCIKSRDKWKAKVADEKKYRG